MSTGEKAKGCRMDLGPWLPNLQFFALGADLLPISPFAVEPDIRQHAISWGRGLGIWPHEQVSALRISMTEKMSIRRPFAKDLRYKRPL